VPTGPICHAALAAAVLVLSGCGSAEVDTTTSPPPETPVNPWDLPLEERPPLFDPCIEIPIETIEQGVGEPVTGDDQFESSKPGQLRSCGWRNEEVIIGIVGTWRSQEEFLADPEFGPIDVKSS